MSGGLLKYEAARRALAEAHRVDEVKAIRDKAVAIKAYAKQANDDSLLQMATEIKLRAERRAGELLRETASRKERRGRGRAKKQTSTGDDISPTLKTLGITRDQSSDWQKLAAIPAEDFEDRVTQAARVTVHDVGLKAERIVRGPEPRKPRQPIDVLLHVQRTLPLVRRASDAVDRLCEFATAEALSEGGSGDVITDLWPNTYLVELSELVGKLASAFPILAPFDFQVFTWFLSCIENLDATEHNLDFGDVTPERLDKLKALLTLVRAVEPKLAHLVEETESIERDALEVADEVTS